MCVRGADGKDIGVSQLIMVQQLVRWLQACLHLLHGSMATETSRTLLSVRPGPPTVLLPSIYRATYNS